MSTAQGETQSKPATQTLFELQEAIDRACKKVRGSKENDICKFLPVSTGGYMHHFTMRKMKNVQPKELLEMIDQYILKVEQPVRVEPKPRAARGSRKRPDLISLSKEELDRLVTHLRLAGDAELAGKLCQKRSLAACKKQLINSIKANQIRPDYWSAYVEACKAHNNDSQTSEGPAQTPGCATLQANG